MGFTTKQQRFIEVYNGNGVQAAREAGYGGSYSALGKTAFDLLKNPKIKSAIDARNKGVKKLRIATREERQAFWTSVMEDKNQEMRDRLKASELLGRSETDFLEKIEHSGVITLEKLLCGEPEDKGEGT